VSSVSISANISKTDLAALQITTPERERWMRASWFDQTILGGHANRDFFQKISAVYKKRLGLESDRIFKKVWDQALAAHDIRWDVRKPLTIEEFNKIEAVLKDTLIYHGKGVEIDGAGPDPQVHEIIQFLLGQGTPSREWLNAKNAKGILIRKDPALLKAMRDEFRAVLKSCGEHLPIPGSKEEILYKTFIGNIVALLPYAYPEEGEVFSIPQKINGEWKNSVYTVDRKIELSPKWFSSPIAAYGLTSKEGPPLLTFLGTTYPAGEGYLATLLSDVTPFMSVGHAPYIYGKKQIEEWLNDKEQVRLCGTSLGGALSFHVLRNHKEKIAQVDAYNPPGLHPWQWKEKFNDSVEINIVYNENDLVGTLGAFPEGDKVNVIRPVLEKNQNSIKAHAQAYSGNKEVMLLKSDPAYENSRISRKLLTVCHFFLSCLLAFIPILLAYLVFSLFNALIFHPLGLLKQKI